MESYKIEKCWKLQKSILGMADMEIKRDYYLHKLINRRGNGLVKIIIWLSSQPFCSELIILYQKSCRHSKYRNLVSLVVISGVLILSSNNLYFQSFKSFDFIALNSYPRKLVNQNFCKTLVCLPKTLVY